MKNGLIANSKELPGLIDEKGVVVHEIGLRETKKIAKIVYDVMRAREGKFEMTFDDLIDRVCEILPDFVFRDGRPLEPEECYMKFSEYYALWDVFKEVNPDFLRTYKVALKVMGIRYSDLEKELERLFSEEELPEVEEEPEPEIIKTHNPQNQEKEQRDKSQKTEKQED